jgi:hypothetical protein
MDGPCVGPTGPYAFWAFVVFALLSHARGTALLLREVLTWWRGERTRHFRRRTP